MAELLTRGLGLSVALTRLFQSSTIMNSLSIKVGRSAQRGPLSPASMVWTMKVTACRSRLCQYETKRVEYVQEEEEEESLCNCQIMTRGRESQHAVCKYWPLLCPTDNMHGISQTLQILRISAARSANCPWGWTCSRAQWREKVGINVFEFVSLSAARPSC